MNPKRTQIRLVAFFFIMILACLLSLMSFAYDGGPLCFFSPKKCPLNRTVKPVLTPVQVVKQSTTTPITPTLPPTPTQFNPDTPTPTLDPEITPTVETFLETERQRFEIECGRNPYRYNYMEDNWERPFENLCFVATEDPFDIVFGGDDLMLGLDYDQVISILGILDADPNSKESQVQTLVDHGLWDYGCACVPDGGDYNKVIQDILAGPTETPAIPVPEDKTIED